MIKFVDMYLEFVRPQALTVANSAADVRDFVTKYVTQIDEAIYHKDTKSACVYAMQWQDDMVHHPSFTTFHAQWRSLSRLKKLVDQLVDAPF